MDLATLEVGTPRVCLEDPGDTSGTVMKDEMESGI